MSVSALPSPEPMINQPASRTEDLLPPAQSMRAPTPILLTVLMGVLSVVMWAVSPVFWLWFAAKVAGWTTGSGQLTMPLAAMILAGIVVTTIGIGKLLGVINRWHMHLTGLDRGPKHARAWNKSMRDARERTRERGILEPVMFASLGTAAVLVVVYFLLNPHMTLPG